MNTPDPWQATLLALAAYRTWHLIAADEILNRPRNALLNRRPFLDRFVGCAWCLGFWIGLSWWAAWMLEPVTAAVAAPFAISAAVGLLGKDD